VASVLNNVRARENGDTTRPWKKKKKSTGMVNLYRSKKEAQDKLLRKEVVEGKRELSKRMKMRRSECAGRGPR
jgi:alkylated DNA nucleotide flippase Atl1